MRKIMFSEHFGLTKAVLEGRKTMTRRIISTETIEHILEDFKQEYFEATLDVLESDKEYIEQYFLVENRGKCFRRGDIVAVAQAYRDVRDIIGDIHDGKSIKFMAGWHNKRFVRADLMPNRIRITGVRVERLQDISDQDCLREGIYNWKDAPDCPPGHKDSKIECYGYDGSWDGFSTPREAFAALIDKVSGKGTFASNPWVFVYEFELVK